MGLFSRSKSSSVVNTTQENYDNRQAVGDASIGLAAGATYNQVQELSDNAVSVLSTFGQVIGEIASEGIKGAKETAKAGADALGGLTTQVKSSGVATDLRSLAPYALGAVGLVLLYMVFKKG